MDEQNKNEISYTPKSSHFLMRNVELGVGGILLGLGFFVMLFVILNYFNILSLSSLYPNQLGWLPHRPYSEKQQGSTSNLFQDQTIKESELPIAADIFKNPIVYEWWGSVEGILVAKDDQSITLEKNGNRITILIKDEPGGTGTSFFTEESAKLGPKAQETPINDIPLGSHLRGNFLVHPADKNKIIGSSFTILKR